MKRAHTAPKGLRRRDLASHTLRVLKRGGWGNPDVLLARTPEGRGESAGRVVVKDFAARAPWVRLSFAPFLIGRELRVYRALAGLPAVPRAIGRLDALALVLEYRPGRWISREVGSALPPHFAQALREAVDQMHSRGVVHLDLRHRGNVMVGDDGAPVLLDFASALRFRAGGLAARLLLPLLARLDRRALRKWEARIGPQSPLLPPDSGAGTSGAGTSSAGSRGASRPM